MNFKRFRSLGKPGWLFITLALAAALVVSSWINHHEARSAVAALNQGQIRLLETALRARFHPWSPLPDSVALRQFAEENPEFGIRFLALLDESGDLLVSIGEPRLPPGVFAGPTQDDPYIVVRDRIRAFLPRPPESRVRMRRDPDIGPARRGGLRVAMNVVEVEPVVANELVAGARRTLVFSVVGASLLAFAALLFWQLSERYQQARIRLAEDRRLAQLGEMSAVLAHEIRNPLASLKGNAQLLAERLPDESRERGRADRVVAEATRLESLTTDLLDFARAGPIALAPTDPVALVREAADDAGAGSSEIDGDAPATWPLDAARLRQAVVNLIRNAQQVSPPDRPLIVDVSTSDGSLLIEVRDFGPGIDPDDIDRIFDPFFTTRTSGTGLGLPVARRVVEMHGGTLTAGNAPGGGAVFRILIPRSAEAS